jgi:hypothetical protein
MGERVVGTVRYPTGDAGLRDGTIDGRRIRFKTVHTPQFESTPAEISFEGRIEGEVLELVLQDSNGIARLTARRSSAPAEA